MSASMKAAFNMAIRLHSRDAMLKDRNTKVEYPIKIATSNYFRKLEAPEETIIEGFEFVIPANSVDGTSLPSLRRGSRIIDSTTGQDMTIDNVKEMFVLNNILVGYRVRTS